MDSATLKITLNVSIYKRLIVNNRLLKSYNAIGLLIVLLDATAAKTTNNA